MDLKNFRFDLDTDGVATLTWDMADRSMNVITEEVMNELEQVIRHVAATPDIKGCVVISGKPDFSGGADLGMLEGSSRRFAETAASKGEEIARQEFFDGTRRLSLIYRELETSGKPCSPLKPLPTFCSEWG